MVEGPYLAPVHESNTLRMNLCVIEYPMGVIHTFFIRIKFIRITEAQFSQNFLAKWAKISFSVYYFNGRNCRGY